jgi:protein-S-isoprenylcysteine O-methyltransferase Ste14
MADVLQVSSNMRVTRPFIIGSALVIIGGLMRLACYLTLGKLFTFELSIMKDHKLVTTGLYRFVRHPSYLAYTLVLGGLCLSQMTHGSWLIESGVLSTWTGRGVVGLWHLWAWYLWAMTFGRARKEDGYLHMQFGQQWVDWQKRVPYCMFPGIF